MAKQNNPKTRPGNSHVTSKSTSGNKGSSRKIKRAATGEPSGLPSNQSPCNMEQLIRELDSYFEEKLGSGTVKSTKGKLYSVSKQNNDGAIEQGKKSKRVRFSNVLEYSKQDSLKACSPLRENHSCTSFTLSSEFDCEASYPNMDPKFNFTKTKSSITPFLSKTKVPTFDLGTAHSLSLPAMPQVENQPVKPSIHSTSLPAISRIQNQPIEQSIHSPSLLAISQVQNQPIEKSIHSPSLLAIPQVQMLPIEPSIHSISLPGIFQVKIQPIKPSNNIPIPSSSQQTGVAATLEVEVFRANAPVQCESISKETPSQRDHAKTIVQSTMDIQPAEETLHCSPTQEERLQRRVSSDVPAPDKTSAIYTSPNFNSENNYYARSSIDGYSKLGRVGLLRGDPPLNEHASKRDAEVLIGCVTKLPQAYSLRDDPPLTEHLSSNKDDGAGDSNTASGAEYKHYQLATPSTSADFRDGDTSSLTASASPSGKYKPSSVKLRLHLREDGALANHSSEDNKQDVSGANFDTGLLNCDFKTLGTNVSSLDYSVTNCNPLNTQAVPSPLKTCTTNCATDIVSQTNSSRYMALGATDGLREDAAPFESINTVSSGQRRPVTFVMSSCNNKPTTVSSSSSALSITPFAPSSPDSGTSITFTKAAQAASASATRASSYSSNCSSDSVPSSSCVFADYESVSDNPEVIFPTTAPIRSIATMASLPISASISSDSEARSVSTTTLKSCPDLPVLEAGKDLEPHVPHAFNKYCLCSLPLMCQGHETGPFRSLKLTRAVPVSRTDCRTATDVVLLPRRCAEGLKPVTETQERGCEHDDEALADLSSYPNDTLKDSCVVMTKSSQQHSGPDQKDTQFQFRMTIISSSGYKTSNVAPPNEDAHYSQTLLGLKKSKRANKHYSASAMSNYMDELQNNESPLDGMNTDACQHTESTVTAPLHNNGSKQNPFTTPSCNIAPFREYLTSVPESSCCESDDTSSSFTPSQLGKTLNKSARRSSSLMVPYSVNKRAFIRTDLTKSSPQTTRALMNTATKNCVVDNPDECSLSASLNNERINMKQTSFSSEVHPQDSDTMGPTTREIFQYHLTSRVRVPGTCADPRGELSLSPWAPARLSFGLDSCDGERASDASVGIERVRPQFAKIGEITSVRKQNTSSEKETCRAARFDIDVALLEGLEDVEQSRKNACSPGRDHFKMPLPVTTSRRHNLRRVPCITDGETGASSDAKHMTDVMKRLATCDVTGRQSCIPTKEKVLDTRDVTGRQSCIPTKEKVLDTRDVTGRQSCIPTEEKVRDNREVTGRIPCILTEEKVTGSTPSAGVYAVQSSRETGIDTQELFRTQPTPYGRPSVDREESRQLIPGSLSSSLVYPLTTRTYQMQRYNSSTLNCSSAMNMCNEELGTKEVQGFPEFPVSGKFLTSQKVSKTNVINRNTSIDHQQLSSDREHNVDLPVISGQSSSFNSKAVPFNNEDIIEIIKCCGEIDWNELSDNFTHDPTLVTPKNANCNVPSTPSKSTTNAHSESTVTSLVSSNSSVQQSSSTSSHESIRESKNVTAAPSFSATRGRRSVMATPTVSAARGRNALSATPTSGTTKGRRALSATPSNNVRGLRAAPDCECQSCRGYKHIATSFMSKLFREARTSCTTTTSGAGHLTSGSLPSCIESISEEEQLSRKLTRDAKRPRKTCRRRLAFVDSDNSSSLDYNPYKKENTTRDSSIEEDTSEACVLSPQRELRTTGHGETSANRRDTAQKNLEVNIPSPQPEIQTSDNSEAKKNNIASSSKLEKVLYDGDDPQERAVVKSAINKPLVTTLLYNTIGQDTVRINPYQKGAKTKQKTRKRFKRLKYDACYVCSSARGNKI